MRIRGSFAPVPTPVDEVGRFDPQALGAHLAWLASTPLDGALVLGSNGEFPSFTLSERLAVAEAAAASRGALTLLLGIGSCALEEALDMVEAAADLGYAAALLPPPFYLRGAPVAGLAAFLRAVLDRARLPVLLYHVPQLTGVPLDENLLERVEGHPRLAGVKDSTGRVDEMERLLRRFGSRSYLVGNDRLVAATLAAGGTGSISAAASVAPGLVAAIPHDPERQEELDAVRALLEEFGLVAGVKALLRARGLGRYGARPPSVELDPARVRDLRVRFEGLWGA